MFESLKNFTNNFTNKFTNKISKNQKVVLIVVVLLVLWFIYTRYENLNGEPIVITNTPNNKQDATEFKQEDSVIHPRVYDRITGQITDASEFIGLPEKIYPANGENIVSNYGVVDKLDDGYNGEMGLNYNMCSKSCCSPQYPTPFELESDEQVNKMKDKFVLNNYACNNAWNNAGCVCMTQEQHKYLSSRGGNAPTCNA
jgi:hypothetical protein